MAKIALSYVNGIATKKNNGATVVMGTVRGNVVTNAPNRAFLGYHDSMGGRVHVIKPLHERALNSTAYAISSVSPFASQSMADRTTLLIRGTCRKIANIGNTSLLNTPQTWGRKSILFNEHNNTIHNLHNEVIYDYATGYPTTTPRVSVDQFGNDVAAHPSRSVPGHLTYLVSKNKPTTGNYSVKNG